MPDNYLCEMRLKRICDADAEVICIAVYGLLGLERSSPAVLRTASESVCCKNVSHGSFYGLIAPQ